jgi:hypothetical protein
LGGRRGGTKYLSFSLLIMADFLVNEVLCVLRTYYGNEPKASIVNVFSEFYTEEEMGTAKKY